MSASFPCPDCNHEIVMPKPASRIVVCPHCQAKFETFDSEVEFNWPQPTWIEEHPRIH